MILGSLNAFGTGGESHGGDPLPMLFKQGSELGLRWLRILVPSRQGAVENWVGALLPLLKLELDPAKHLWPEFDPQPNYPGCVQKQGSSWLFHTPRCSPLVHTPTDAARELLR